MKYSKNEIPFLDILIKRSENVIWMDPKHTYEHKDVCLLLRDIRITVNEIFSLLGTKNL